MLREPEFELETELEQALPTKYSPMDLNGLKQAAAENMRRAFCMQ
jgi:hypothetical protein